MKILIKKFYFGRLGKCYTNLAIVDSQEAVDKFIQENKLEKEWQYETESLPYFEAK